MTSGLTHPGRHAATEAQATAQTQCFVPEVNRRRHQILCGEIVCDCTIDAEKSQTYLKADYVP